MKYISFVTLVPHAKKIDLTKDVGMIPYLLGKNHTYRSKLVCYKNDLYPRTKDCLKGLEIEFLKRIFNNPCIDSLIYLLFNSRDIDILNIYHIGMKRLLLWISVFHLCNPKGIIYLKLDMDYPGIEKLEQESMWEKKIRKKIFGKIEIISAESEEICSRFGSLFDMHIEYIPNGYYSWRKTADIKKQHIILTVGRLGTRQKATEILLQAFAQTASNHDYQLRLVGSVENDFNRFIKEFYKENSHLNRRIEFVGVITDKTKLQEEYEKASIFVLPSRWESFGIVLSEAVGAGDFLIVSDQVAPRYDFIINSLHGEVCKVDNVEDLCDKIMLGIKTVEKSTDYFKRVKEYAEEKFEWNKIVSRLSFILEDKCE